MDARALVRFEAKYEVALTGCWLWTGSVAGPEWKTGGGYGSMFYRGKRRAAHRLAYEHYVGPIPDGLTIDHLCRVRHCVNPAHMEAVTMRENLLRGTGASARNARVTHCPQGHPLSGDNLYLDPRGHRQCRACRRVAFQAWKHRSLP